MPGGVNSPVRAFNAVGGAPIYFKKGFGANLWDTDGQKYIDYVGSWGPAILGHAHPEVINAVKKVAEDGLSFGSPTEHESHLAEQITKMMPSIEMLRLVSTGTEACMSAVRLARAYTKRDKFVKFNGCYHGHADFFLVQAGSGAATLGLPNSPGVPASFTQETLTCPYNDSNKLVSLFESFPDDIACIILEPFVGNAGFIKPTPEFLEVIKSLCEKYNCLLIFDEVMTGFRVAKGGAQELLKMKPDLTTLGKVIGGGLPVGAYGGRREIMQLIAPSGPVYQAGTLSGNPLAVCAGLKTLEILDKSDYQQLGKLSASLMQGLHQAAEECGIDFQSDFCGGMFGFFFHNQAVSNFEAAKNANADLFKRFYQKVLAQKVYFAPSPFEAGFMSFAHTENDIQQTIGTCRQAFKELQHD